MDSYLVSFIIQALAGLFTSVCWVVLWLKTGHGAGWAVLGILPLVFSLGPGLIMSTSFWALEYFMVLNMSGSLLFMAYLAFFTFKRWPIQNWKDAAEASE